MKSLDTLAGFAFGEGAFMEDGVPINIEFSNCEMTLWVRALDGNMMADLAEDGVDLSPLFQTKEDEGAAKIETLETLAERFDLQDDKEIRAEIQALLAKQQESAIEAIKRNREQYRILVRRLVVKFEGLKRSGGTPVECNEKSIDGFAGYPEMVVTVIAAAFMVARDIAGNSESSSDGNDTQTALPDGEPTTSTTENVA